MRVAQRLVVVPEVSIRRATQYDVPGIAEFYATLPESSLHMRFSGGMSGAALGRAAAFDPDSDVTVFVAAEGDKVVGEARYLPDPEGGYEFAVAVAHGLQHHGIGRALLDLLREDAAARGIATLRALVRVDNVAMLRTLRAIGGVIVRPADGWDIEAELSTDDDLPGWPAGTEGRRVLIESSALWDNPATASLRDAGFEIRQCLGPRPEGPQTCPLVVRGHCRLADQADVVACLLSRDTANTREVAAEHAARRPERLAARSATEWPRAAAALLG